MAWTESQRLAIGTRGRNLLVAAAAGSGKTAVLVERIIRQVLDGECDVDRLLVVTFTHAAAEEMRMRIEAALRKQLEQTMDEKRQERLERQLILLSGASISTLHSFCQTVIRQNFSALDLDPEFRLAGEQELQLMKQDVLVELFEEEYEKGREEFLHFVDAFGGDERGDEKLYELVLRLYHYAQSQPFPEAWLKSLPTGLDLPENASLADTPWYGILQQKMRRELDGALEEAGQALEDFEVLGAGPYAETLKSDIDVLQSLRRALEADSWDAMQKAFSSVSFERLKSLRGVDEGLKEAASLVLKNSRDHYKKLVSDMQKECFQETEADRMEDMRASSKDIAELCSLTENFAAAFAAAKHRKSIADFNDLEHFALQILCEHGTGEDELVPSASAKALQRHFQAVMVDEYQDINGVQEAILSLLASPGKPNLFCVGDVKQSIYRFRLADPTLFLKKYREYPKLGKEYARIDLSRNFRSRPEVLSAINFVFAQVMSEGAMELAYDEAAALHPGAEYPPCDGRGLKGPAELHIIFDDGEEASSKDEAGEQTAEEGPKGLEREAMLISRRLWALMEEKCQVFDKDRREYRPLRWQDIVILLSSVRGKADKVLEVLRQHGIPAYAEVDAGYFERQEVRVMLALLSVLHNVRQDVPLAAVLVSPIGNLGFADLAQIRLAAEDEDLYGALLKAIAPDSSADRKIAEKISLFLERLSHWRMLSRELSVPELIWQLYRDTGYYDYVGGLPEGILRQANLRMLVDRAAEYEATDFRGLFRFLRFVERMRDMDTDLAVARTLGEKEDVVRIMSIHKSKGLEFPVVILANMGKKFNLRDASETLLMHRELGLGPYRVNREESFRYPTFARQAIAAKILQEHKAEELRVLYVAMTRAREKLILVGTVANEKKLREKAVRWSSHAKKTCISLPEYASFAAESFLDWVGMAVARHGDGAALREKAEVSSSPTAFLDYEDDSRWEVHLTSASDLQAREIQPSKEDEVLAAVAKGEFLPDSPKREAVRELLNWHYDMRGLGMVPAKLSVTEIKRRFAEQEQESRHLQQGRPAEEWRRPDFLQGKKGFTSMEYGTFMHSVMQHIDYRRDVSYSGIRNQLEEMLDAELLLPEHMEAIRIKNVQSFFQSSLGQRLRKSLRAWRELSFSRMLPAHRFYEEVQGEEELFVQGVIDLLFEEADGSLVLVDYKTDRDTSPDRVQSAYRIQMDIYSQAVSDILGHSVKERYLYMLHDGSVVDMG
ncbi:MAG: helicase-exonuclease AddAB subunit AddA [Selenomonadaceae bacterium]|nr:helicase-exonuclease AddAB subunit AddA [Selenomonadaceae bacterium]